MKINVGTYGNYKSSNYSGHCLRLTFGTLTLFFSYKTVVAFADDKNNLTVIQNEWGNTTGKHLNMIDGGSKKSRLPHAEFSKLLKATLLRHNLDLD